MAFLFFVRKHRAPKGALRLRIAGVFVHEVGDGSESIERQRVH